MANKEILLNIKEVGIRRGELTVLFLEAAAAASKASTALSLSNN